MDKRCANCKHWDRSKMIIGLQSSEAPCKDLFSAMSMVFFPDYNTCRDFEKLPIRGVTLLTSVKDTVNKLDKYSKILDNSEITERGVSEILIENKPRTKIPRNTKVIFWNGTTEIYKGTVFHAVRRKIENLLKSFKAS